MKYPNHTLNNVRTHIKKVHRADPDQFDIKFDPTDELPKQDEKTPVENLHGEDSDELEIKTVNTQNHGQNSLQNQETTPNKVISSTCPLCDKVFKGTKSNTQILNDVRRHIRSVHYEDPKQFDLKTKMTNTESPKEEKTLVGNWLETYEDPDEFEMETDVSDNEENISPPNPIKATPNGSQTCPLCDKVFKGPIWASSTNLTHHIDSSLIKIVLVKYFVHLICKGYLSFWLASKRHQEEVDLTKMVTE